MSKCEDRSPYRLVPVDVSVDIRCVSVQCFGSSSCMSKVIFL